MSLQLTTLETKTSCLGIAVTGGSLTTQCMPLHWPNLGVLIRCCRHKSDSLKSVFIYFTDSLGRCCALQKFVKVRTLVDPAFLSSVLNVCRIVYRLVLKMGLQIALCRAGRLTLKEGLGNRHSSGVSAYCTCSAIILSYKSFNSSTCSAVLGNPSITRPAESADGSNMVSKRASPTCKVL